MINHYSLINPQFSFQAKNLKYSADSCTSFPAGAIAPHEAGQAHRLRVPIRRIVQASPDRNPALTDNAGLRRSMWPAGLCRADKATQTVRPRNHLLRYGVD